MTLEHYICYRLGAKRSSTSSISIVVLYIADKVVLQLEPQTSSRNLED